MCAFLCASCAFEPMTSVATACSYYERATERGCVDGSLFVIAHGRRYYLALHSSRGVTLGNGTVSISRTSLPVGFGLSEPAASHDNSSVLVVHHLCKY